MTETFQLTTQERHSTLWARLMKHFEDKLATARARNDDADEATTAKLRGQIAAYKTLMELDREPIDQ